MAFQSDEQRRELIRRLGTTKDPVGRIQLLGTLRKLADSGDQEVDELFRRLAEIDPSEAVRDFAARCRTMAGSPAASGPASLRSDEPPPPVGPAPEPPPPEPKDERLAKLVRLLHHESPEYRLKAVQAAAQVGVAEALPHLTALLASESAGSVLEALLPAIAALDSEGAHFTRLLPFLRSEDVQARLGAVRAMAGYDDERKYRLLIPLATDRDSSVKSAAIASLGRISREKLMAELTTMATMGNLQMKEQVLEFVEALKGDDVVTLLLTLAGDVDASLRKRAIGKIAARGDRRLLDLVVAWIRGAAPEDLQVLLDALDPFDRATKGAHRTDCQIMRTRIERILSGDEMAREVDLVLAVMKAGDSDAAVASTARASATPAVDATRSAALDAMLNRPSTPAEAPRRAAEAPRRARHDKGALDDGGVLQQMSFITRLIFILKVAAAFSCVYLLTHYLEPMWDAYMVRLKRGTIAHDFQVVREAIRRSEVSGGRWTGTSSEDLIEKGLLQRCLDPWGQPYLVFPEWGSIVCTGQDGSYPTTTVVHLRADASIVPRDDLRSYYGRGVPPALWVGVDAPGQPGLWEISVDGAAAHDITSAVPTLLVEPVLSPDRQLMAWTAHDEAGVAQVFVGTPSGGGGRQLTRGDGDCRGPAWRPDGRSVLFSTRRAALGGREKVASVTVGGTETVYFKGMPDDDSHPAPVPGTERFAFCRRLAGRAGQIKLYDPEWDGPRDPSGAVPGDHPFPVAGQPARGFFFLGAEGDATYGGLYFLGDGATAPRSVVDEASLTPPYLVVHELDGVFVVLRVDEGWLLRFRPLDEGARARARRNTPPEYNLLLSPWPITSLSWRGDLRVAPPPTSDGANLIADDAPSSAGTSEGGADGEGDGS